MATAITSTPAKAAESESVSRYRTVADLLEHLGGVPPSRVRFQPLAARVGSREVAKRPIASASAIADPVSNANQIRVANATPIC